MKHKVALIGEFEMLIHLQSLNINDYEFHFYPNIECFVMQRKRFEGAILGVDQERLEIAEEVLEDISLPYTRWNTNDASVAVVQNLNTILH